MHRSLDALSKQLTHFFNVQKNLFFSLENNNTINTYIHPNDKESVQSKLIFSLSIYNVTFPEFDKNASPNQKNNNSASDSSDYVSNINSLPTLFSLVFSLHRFKQHFNPKNVFSSLLSLSFNLSHSFTVDSLNSTDINFEKLLL
jgi:hypothetical protein